MRVTFLLICLISFVPRAAADTLATSIVPLQSWAQALLSEEHDVLVLIGPGQSPELFEPSARQLTRLADAKVLFTVGAPFEANLIPRLAGMFGGLEVLELGRDLERLDWVGSEEHGHSGDPDPHVWVAPANGAALIVEMSGALTARFPADAEGIRVRADELASRYRAVDDELSRLLRPLQGQDLLAYHPALGYFAHAYGFRQVAVETGGTGPGAKHLTRLSTQMHEQSLRVLVVEPQFAPQRARSVAASMGLAVLEFDPLGADLATGLREFGHALLLAGQIKEQP